MKLHVIYTTKEDKSEFYNALLAGGIPEKVRRENGCFFYEYAPGEGGPRELHLYEAWATSEAQQKHLAQPHMKALAALKQQYVENTRVLPWE